MKLQYRAIEATNTKTRRLAYFTAILLTLYQSSMSESALLKKIIAWSQGHQAALYNYYVHTGEITLTGQNSGGIHYLEAAANLKLIIPLAGIYHTSRFGAVLTALTRKYQPNSNPFFLTCSEKLFYVYWLFKVDADMLFTIIDCVLEQKGISLADLQRTFQISFLKRIEKKILITRDEGVRAALRDRKIKVEGEWKNPKRYAEHIVPPRLNWLLDLGLLKERPFCQHCFEFTEEGREFFSFVPCLENSNLHDITDQWLDLNYWQAIAHTLEEGKKAMSWIEIDEERQYQLIEPLLKDAFRVFRSAFVPKVSLAPTMLYLSISLLIDHRIVASPFVLIQWFSSVRVVDENRYEMRLSPRENESYLIIL